MLAIITDSNSRMTMPDATSCIAGRQTNQYWKQYQYFFHDLSFRIPNVGSPASDFSLEAWQEAMVPALVVPWATQMRCARFGNYVEPPRRRWRICPQWTQ